MKIALIHDALVNKGGAERVFQVFCEIFPDADIFTSVYVPNKTFQFFKKRKIKTIPNLNKIKSEKIFKMLFPYVNFLMSRLKLNEYDIVLSSSTFCAKYVKNEKSIHICYCHTPFRLLWQPDKYLNKWQKIFAYPFLLVFRGLDYHATQNIDLFITNSVVSQKRISKNYKRKSIILHPPIDSHKYKSNNNIGDYFLVVSRLEKYKKVYLVIEAFNILKKKLYIVGKGKLESKLKRYANSNIKFLGQISESKLLSLYAHCKAVIFPQFEDFGIVPLEANASGRPVIAYGDGGVLETMIPYDGYNENKATSLFFSKQSVEDIVDAVKKFEAVSFNKKALIQNAKRFDVLNFRANIKNIVSDVFKRSKYDDF